jgi:hypothetical protein
MLPSEIKLNKGPRLGIKVKKCKPIIGNYYK